MDSSIHSKRIIAGLLIIAVFVLAFFVLKPIIVAVVFGLLFAYIFRPLYGFIKKYLKGENLSALALIAVIGILIAIPIAWLAPTLVNEIFDAYLYFQDVNITNLLSNWMQSDLATSIGLNLESLIATLFSKMISQFSNILVNLSSWLLQFAVFLFTFYFAVRDSDKMKKYISDLSPFRKTTEDKFSNEFRGVTNAIIFGQVLIGIIQGLAVGIGFFVLGVPSASILTFVACIVSIIPVLGSWLVWLPVAIYLLIKGSTFAGIFLLLYGALFVSVIDNLLRPYILSKKSNLPISIGVIGTIGGLYFFGIAGLVLGPLVLAYVLIIIEFYRQGKLDELFTK